MNNKCSLLVVVLVIVAILIVAMGVFVYSEKTEENIIKNEELLGKYEYKVPQKVKDEHGNYYNEITVRLLEDNKFEYDYGDTFTVEGVYQIENDNIICNAQIIKWSRLDKELFEDEINVMYTFKYSNNTLEIIKQEGKVKVEISDYEISGDSIEIKELGGPHEEIGSKFIKK